MLDRLKAAFRQTKANVADLRPTETEAAATKAAPGGLAKVTETANQLLKVRWWLWRHHYLEAKRIQLAQRRQQGGR